MGRPYTVPFEAVAISAVQDIWNVTPADDKPVRILGWTLSNVGGTADAGDDDEEFWRLVVSRIGIAGQGASSGGSAATPQPTNAGDAAASFTARVNDTTLSTATNSVTIIATGHNIRNVEWVWLPDPVEVTATQGNTSISVRLMAAPGDAVTCSGTLLVEEL